jgi:hypothetical protein
MNGPDFGDQSIDEMVGPEGTPKTNNFNGLRLVGAKCWVVENQPLNESIVSLFLGQICAFLSASWRVA